MSDSEIFEITVPVSDDLPRDWTQAGGEQRLHELLEAAGHPRRRGAIRLLKRSLDLRGRGEPRWRLRIEHRSSAERFARWAPNAERAAGAPVLVIGAGPAGTFAALELVEAGLSPIVIDRGEAVRPRRKALADLSARGRLHEDSNYCFGEGGAGTFSDGKLYTRVKDKAGVRRILEMLTHFGAPEAILYEARPHIGSNRLPPLLTSLREHLEARGVVYHWNRRVIGLRTQRGRVCGVELSDGSSIDAAAVVLATGHSARDVYTLCAAEGVAIQFKPFALGGRIEHPQALIDQAQYGRWNGKMNVGAAAYAVRCQVEQNGESTGVYSFCMCPGGYIVPASTDPERLVVNGMSLSKRGSPYANSGLVVTIDQGKVDRWAHDNGRADLIGDPLAGLAFQDAIEARAYTLGGGDYVAPAQRVTDLVKNRRSADLPSCSYPRGVVSASLADVFPASIFGALQRALPTFDRQVAGYFTDEAIVVATESRSSSPVRIERDRSTCESPSHPGLFPCGEGAGQAGGIASAGLDGIRVARAICQQLGGSS